MEFVIVLVSSWLVIVSSLEQYSTDDIIHLLQQHDREIKVLRDDNVYMKKELENVKMENTLLKEMLFAQNGAISTLKQDFDENWQDVKYSHVKANMSSPSLERKERLLAPSTDQTTNSVAFTANLLTGLTGLGKFQTIIFDTVETNIGDGYSAATGIFTAPTAGTYFFLSTICVGNGGFLRTEIAHNGNYLNHVFSSDVDVQEQGTNGGVLVLAEGDEVWVRTADERSHEIYGSKYSTFSGFRIGA